MTSRHLIEQERRNSLGLTEGALEAVFNQLDAGAPAGHRGRHSARWPFRHAAVRVVVQHAGGTSAEIFMACRNLSRTGAGLLHRGFVHPGTPCVLTLQHPENGPVPVPGTVRRCVHRSGVVHEVGVEFAEPIDLRGFLQPDPLREWFESERPVAETLHGTMLHIEPNAVDQKIVKHFLKDTSVRIVLAETVADAIARAAQGVDLILCSADVGGISGSAVLRDLRAENVRAPAVIVGFPSQECVRVVTSRLAQAFLSKPIQQEKLLSAVAEFVTKTDRVAQRAGASEPGLLDALRPDIKASSAAISTAWRANDHIRMIAACSHLVQIMTAIGLDKIAEEIEDLLCQVSGAEDLAFVRDSVRRVVDQCARYS